MGGHEEEGFGRTVLKSIIQAEDFLHEIDSKGSMLHSRLSR